MGTRIEKGGHFRVLLLLVGDQLLGFGFFFARGCLLGLFSFADVVRLFKPNPKNKAKAERNAMHWVDCSTHRSESGS